jgi:hypothetical protein
MCKFTRKDDSEMDLNSTRGCRMDLSGSGDGQVAYFCEHENEYSVFKIGAECFTI